MWRQGVGKDAGAYAVTRTATKRGQIRSFTQGCHSQKAVHGAPADHRGPPITATRQGPMFG